MDRLEAMRVVLAVVDAGSISAASRKLGAPLPTVSRKVAELERFLGSNLLIRTSRAIQLTDAGREYVAAARRIVVDLEEAERRASGEYQTPRGVLSVTMPNEFGARHVMPVALSFMQEHPEVTLRCIASDAPADMVAQQIDVAIRLGALADSTLHAVRVGGFRLMTCASPVYLDRRGAPASPRELPDHDGILFGRPETFWSYRVDGEVLVCAPRTRIVVDGARGALLAALGGGGVARLFDYQIADHLRSGALVRLLPDHDGEPRPAHIVYPRQGLLPLKVRAFVDWATPRLRAACAGFDSV